LSELREAIIAHGTKPEVGEMFPLGEEVAMHIKIVARLKPACVATIEAKFVVHTGHVKKYS
jgi:hypothetical protein